MFDSNYTELVGRGRGFCSTEYLSNSVCERKEHPADCKEVVKTVYRKSSRTCDVVAEMMQAAGDAGIH